jgi:hypothetical protein
LRNAFVRQQAFDGMTNAINPIELEGQEQLNLGQKEEELPPLLDRRE